MKNAKVALLEPKAALRKSLAQSLRRAGLKVSEATTPVALTKEGLVVLGPGLASPSRTAAAVKRTVPNARLISAQSRGYKKAPWADAVLPVPVSVADLKVRLDEWAASSKAEPPRQPQGILDPLTQFYTFAHFKEVLFIEVKRARRYGFPLGLALMELDPLPKLSNAAREQLFGGLAFAIRRSIRDTDYPVETATQQVLLLMPHTDLAGALIVARRIVETVARTSVHQGDDMIRATLSVGVSFGQPGREFGFADLVRSAQAGLAQAKLGGGSRVEFHDAIAELGQRELNLR